MTTTRGIVALVTVAVAGVAGAVYLKARDREHDAQIEMRSALHNVAVAQSAYFSDNRKYFSTIPDYMNIQAKDAQVTVLFATDTSWAATATHPRSSQTCSWSHAHSASARYDQVDKASPGAKISQQQSCK